MVQLFEKYPVSDHIAIAAFPAAKEKDDICVFGSLTGISDYTTAAGDMGSVCTGRMTAVFQAASADLTGDAAIGADVYLTPAGALTTAAAGNKLFGTVVRVDADTFDVARV
jgi:predicted RecA/RadA family phage recombinase